jgi:hypothetical protein
MRFESAYTEAVPNFISRKRLLEAVERSIALTKDKAAKVPRIIDYQGDSEHQLVCVSRVLPKKEHREFGTELTFTGTAIVTDISVGKKSC